jgi:hypothetical protein
MIGLLKKLFGAKPAETTAEVPYKVEATPIPAGTEASVIAVISPVVESVVVVAEAVVPEAVIDQAPAKKTAQPKAAPKPKAPAKPKAKPAA